MFLFPFLAVAMAGLCVTAKPVFQASAQSVETFAYVEVTVRGAVVAPPANPFLGLLLDGELRRDGDSSPAIAVQGFCDSSDGSLLRIRFMAPKAGHYRYRVRLRQSDGGAVLGNFNGEFDATLSRRRGLVTVDPKHPAHFIWSGTGERYFWNGLTTYALMGWTDEAEIRAIIDRAARLRVNRLRVTLIGPRVPDASRWYEPVKPSPQFQFLFGPWKAERPRQVDNPGWDVTRFDVEYWRKFERMVDYARSKDVVISVIFFLDGQDAGADPFGKAGLFGENEKNYYRYAAARLGAYSNVMWDITNEWHLFRDAWWVERMGTFLKSADPYGHLVSCHGRGDFPWMLSQWPDFAMYQMWDEAGGYEAMLQRRRGQAATGHPFPQINEEYGYEDHYPVKWGGNRRPPARSADNRRRQAWDISMAGCYQTTGERANRGDGETAPATPGGWINGGFDASMTMLDGYARMVEFFLSFRYFELEPAPELAANANTRVLALPGKTYVLYLRQGELGGGVRLDAGGYKARWYDPSTGVWTPAAEVRREGPRALFETKAPGTGDWALLLERVEQ